MDYLVETDAGKPHYGTQYTFTTSDGGRTSSDKVEQVVSPVYEKRIVVETNGDIRTIVQAIHSAAPDSSTIVSKNHPSYEASDFFSDLFGGFFAFLLFTYLFRILVKICCRVLGAKTPSEETVGVGWSHTP